MSGWLHPPEDGAPPLVGCCRATRGAPRPNPPRCLGPGAPPYGWRTLRLALHQTVWSAPLSIRSTLGRSQTVRLNVRSRFVTRARKWPEIARTSHQVSSRGDARVRMDPGAQAVAVRRAPDPSATQQMRGLASPQQNAGEKYGIGAVARTRQIRSEKCGPAPCRARRRRSRRSTCGAGNRQPNPGTAAPGRRRRRCGGREGTATCAAPPRRVAARCPPPRPAARRCRPDRGPRPGDRR
jgi:hypothetical protein